MFINFDFVLKVMGQLGCVTVFLILVHHFVLSVFIYCLVFWNYLTRRAKLSSSGNNSSSFLRPIFTRTGLERSPLNFKVGFLSHKLSFTMYTVLDRAQNSWDFQLRGFVETFMCLFEICKDYWKSFLCSGVRRKPNHFYKKCCSVQLFHCLMSS